MSKLLYLDDQTFDRHLKVARRKRTYILFLCLISANPLSANWAQAGVSCKQVFEGQLVPGEGLSQSTARNLFEYSQPKARPMKEYVEELGPNFQAKVASLKEGDIHVDGGAGLGIVSLQLIQAKPGLRSIAVNAQNFWGDFFSFVKSEPTSVFSMKDLKIENFLKEINGVMGTSFKSPAQLESWIQSRQNDGFEYRTGVLQSTLRELISQGNSVQLYTDVWGAYAYSKDRATLLELIYESLGDKGEAYLMSQDQVVREEYEKLHRILHPTEGETKSISFEDHLEKLGDPAIQFEGSWPKTIVIRKQAGRARLGLGIEMISGSGEYTQGAGFPLGVRYRFTSQNQ